MLEALLLDLDGTLLDNPMDAFVPAYLGALAAHVAGLVAPDRFTAELLRATSAMDANDGTGPTNAETFAAAFYPALGIPRRTLEPVLERFYAEVFPGLRATTRPNPATRDVLDLARARGWQVVIATNPLFPRTAIEQRLAWAGAEAAAHDFALVTSYEDMHATKSHPAYYREILARIGRSPAECLMAGDDWGWDIVPTTRMGMAAWWVAAPDAPPPDVTPLAGQGPLATLAAWLRGVPYRAAPGG
jgi:FMN phosphatase YigB (HAD superfamily)